MLSLKLLRRRIAGIRSTQQITRAMYMVSAARLKRAHDRILNARPYADKLREMVQDLWERVKKPYHPLMERRRLEKVLVLVLSTEKGLCGSYNVNLFREVERFMAEANFEVQLDILGRKGWDYFRRRYPQLIKRTYVDQFKRFDYEVAKRLAQPLMEDFLQGEVDGVFLAYNFFRSPLSQIPKIERLLPLEIPLEEEELPPSEPVIFPVEPIYEPPPKELFARLLPRYVEMSVFRALLEHNAGEHGARMTAMDNATKNAQELIEKLTLLYNKARQASITKEVTEIATTAEALKAQMK